MMLMYIKLLHKIYQQSILSLSEGYIECDIR